METAFRGDGYRGVPLLQPLLNRAAGGPVVAHLHPAPRAHQQPRAPRAPRRIRLDPQTMSYSTVL
jgi:hypothetical protein